MESLGKYFLDLRNSKGISYAKIYKDIIIPEDSIRKMEENRFFELGDYGVCKALVFNYARYLEADVDSVMREFKVMMPEKVQSKFIPRETLKEKKILLSTNFLWMVGILIFVIILASILFHANRQGWLQTPNFFKAEVRDSTATAKAIPEPQNKPDTLRTRMKALSESIPAGEKKITASSEAKTVPADTTDYVGNILGESPLNVPLH